MLRVNWNEYGNHPLASYTPDEYVDLLRRTDASTAAQGINRLEPQVRAAVDVDGDIVYSECLDRTLDLLMRENKTFRQGVRDYGAVLRGRLQRQYPRLAKVPVDVLACSYFHAGAGPVPGGGDVILLSGWLGFLSLWFEWIHWSLPLDGVNRVSPSERQENVAKTLRLARALLGIEPQPVSAILTCYDEMEQRLGPEGLADGKGTFHTAVFLRLFILLHEFGHIALGHTDQLRQSQTRDPLSENELATRRAQEREDEYAADRFATETALIFWSTDARPEQKHFLFDGFLRSTLMLFMLVGWPPECRVEHPLNTHPMPFERFQRVTQMFDVPQATVYRGWAEALMRF